MKAAFVSLLLFALLGMSVSCHKNINNGYAASGLSGRWDVVVDSFSAGVAAGNHLEVYGGKDGDYYDFRSDSNLYVKEGNNLYTYPYHVTSASSVVIVVPDDVYDTASISYTITNLTSHTVTLTNGWFPTPGGTFGRVVYLKR